MNLRNIITETIFLIIVGSLFSYSLVMGIVSTTEFNYNIVSIGWQVMATLAVLRIIFYNKWTIIASTCILIVAAGILTYEHLTSSYYETAYTTFSIISELILNTTHYLSGIISYEPEFELVITWALIGSISLFVFIFGFVIFNFFILFSFGATLYATILVSSFFNFHIAFYGFIAASIAFLIKYLNSKTLKNYSPFSLYTIPITAIAMIIALNIPTPREGFAGETADNLLVRPFNFINETLYDAFRPMHFSLSQTGFGSGDARRLGGDVRPNYNVVMRVQSNQDVLYLTGAILDTYTGYSWVNTFAGEELELIASDRYYNIYSENYNNRRMWVANTDLMERNLSLLLTYLTSDYEVTQFIENFLNLEEYIPEIRKHSLILHPMTTVDVLKIDTHNNSTMSIFYNGIILSYEASGFNIQTNRNETLTATNRIPRSYIYTINHFDLANVNTSALLQITYSGLLKDALEFIENLEPVEPPPLVGSDLTPWIQWNALQDLYRFREETIELLDDLIIRRNFIYDHFTTLPEHLPQRVIDLAFYVTEGAENDYQRARMLEAYLRQFPYTLEPGNLPFGVDFVEHFLFYLQKGYCVHYATAFVVMARALGMPTRYVEGFIATGMGYNEFFYVRNRQGHAWAEVYFEGFGWHRFDPTPPAETFGVMFQNPSSFNAEGGVNSSLTQEQFQEFWNQFEQEFGSGENNLDFDVEYAYDALLPVSFLTNRENLVTTTETEVVPNVGFDIRPILRQAVFIVLSVLAILIVLRVLIIATKHYKNIKKPNNEAVIYIFNEIVERLKFLECYIQQDETAISFSKRIGSRFKFKEETTTMVDIAYIYQKAMYSPHTVTNEERKMAYEALNTIEKHIQKYTSKPKYFVKRYVLAK